MEGNAVAIHYGKSIDLFDEITHMLEHTPPEAPMNLWLIRDYLDGCMNIQFAEEEFREALARIKEEYGITLRDGSLEESIQRATPHSLLAQSVVERKIPIGVRLNWLTARTAKIN